MINFQNKKIKIINLKFLKNENEGNKKFYNFDFN